MFAHGPSYNIKIGDLPSDEFVGAGLGSIKQRNFNIHTSYLLTFQRTVK